MLFYRRCKNTEGNVQWTEIFFKATVNSKTGNQVHSIPFYISKIDTNCQTKKSLYFKNVNSKCTLGYWTTLITDDHLHETISVHKPCAVDNNIPMYMIMHVLNNVLE